MFAVTGKIWSIDKVDFDNRKYLRLMLKKKRHDKEINMSFLIFKDVLIKQCKQENFTQGDYIEVMFYIKANEFNDRYYNNLFVDKITMLKRAKSIAVVNAFAKTKTDSPEFSK